MTPPAGIARCRTSEPAYPTMSEAATQGDEAMAPPPGRGDPSRRQTLTGILMMVLAESLFSVSDATAKHLSADFHVVQILWTRYMVQMALVLSLAPWVGLGRIVRTERPLLQLSRSALVLAAALCFVSAIRFIPLTDAYSVIFVAPLMVPALSIPILGERVGWRRWAAILGGFAGVLIVIRPGMGVVHPAAFLVLVTASCFALYQVLTRMMSDRDSPLTMLFHGTLLGAVVLSFAVPFAWTAPSVRDWGVIAILGATEALGGLCLIRALALAPASLLAPFAYVQIVWGTSLGYLLFGDVPDGPTLVGAAVVVASGLYVLYREGLTGRPQAPTVQ